MGHRALAFVAFVAFALCAASPAGAQSGKAPKTPWGKPDLNGIWDFRTITPLERPANLADKEFLTAAEAAKLEQDTIERNAEIDSRPSERTTAGGNVDRRQDGTPGFYNNFWLDGGTKPVGLVAHVADHRSAERTSAAPDARRSEEGRGTTGLPSRSILLTGRRTAVRPTAASSGSTPVRRSPPAATTRTCRSFKPRITW